MLVFGGGGGKLLIFGMCFFFFLFFGFDDWFFLVLFVDFFLWLVICGWFFIVLMLNVVFGGGGVGVKFLVSCLYEMIFFLLEKLVREYWVLSKWFLFLWKNFLVLLVCEFL